jgi:prepilin-type N-terminal cleavage/methylation domain-containing protein
VALVSLQRAFTFTELLIAVAVLAMLAAAAMPRFVAINNSAHLTNRIWLSNGRPARLTVDGRTLEMRHGYPTESSISEVVVNSGDFLFKVGYWQHKELMPAPGCAVLYIPPPNPESEPVVISYTDGC